MGTVVRSVLGAALLLTGASAVMAASGNPPVAGQPVQAGAATTTAAAPVAAQPKKPHNSNITDNAAPFGGHDPNSPEGVRAFFVPQY